MIFETVWGFDIRTSEYSFVMRLNNETASKPVSMSSILLFNFNGYSLSQKLWENQFNKPNEEEKKLMCPNLRHRVRHCQQILSGLI